MSKQVLPGGAVILLLSFVLALSACGGSSSNQGGETTQPSSDRPSTPTVLQAPFATPEEVAALIKSKDPAILNGLPADQYQFTCTSEDSEGRRFTCLKTFVGGAAEVTASTYDAVCDAVRCQWEEYPQG